MYVYWVIHDSTPSKEFKLRDIITEEKEKGTWSREAEVDDVCFHLIELWTTRFQYWILSTRLDSIECDVYVLCFYTFFPLRVNSNIIWFYCAGDKNTVRALFMYCLRTVHGSHDTIHTFKKYFATVFSVFLLTVRLLFLFFSWLSLTLTSRTRTRCAW